MPNELTKARRRALRATLDNGDWPNSGWLASNLRAALDELDAIDALAARLGKKSKAKPRPADG